MCIARHRPRSIRAPRRYISGIAIHDARIISDDGQWVTFMAKDYRNKTRKLKQVTGREFVQRFCIHILPPRFNRVRYCGLFGPGKHRELLPLCRQLLAAQQADPPAGEQPELEQPSDDCEPKKASKKCPRCGMPDMQYIGRFTRYNINRMQMLLLLAEADTLTVITTLDVAGLINLTPLEIDYPVDEHPLQQHVQFVIAELPQIELVPLPLPQW